MIRRRALIGAIVVGALAAIGPVMPAYPLTLVTQALIFGILAMSLDVLLGYTGLPSLGQAAYFGVAAYAVALLATERQVGLLGCAAAGIALAAVTAAVTAASAMPAAAQPRSPTWRSVARSATT